MCGGGTGDAVPAPANVTAALAMLDRALDVLHAAEAAALPTVVQAETLRTLERAESRQTAMRARVLTVFAAQGGQEADGQGSVRAWLTWQTRVTSGAAAGAIGWMKRLAAHPVVERALAAGEISASWARQLCDWTGRLPADRCDKADEILVTAAAGGARLADLAVLAEEVYQRCAGPETDADDGFDDRCFRLGITFRGSGRAEGDLTPGCAAALSAVLSALGKKAGPEDARTAAQRRHDALEEACRRLVASGMLPGRAGQPTQIQVHMSLHQLRPRTEGCGRPASTEPAGAANPAGAASQSSATSESGADGPAGIAVPRVGWLSGPDVDAAACDATVIPVVTGNVDWAALDRLTDAFLARRNGSACGPRPAAGLGHLTAATRSTSATIRGPAAAGEDLPAASRPLSPATRRRLSRALLALAADALSGPGGLASQLRARLSQPQTGAGLNYPPLTSISLPLDIGAATETIPAHLRRAVTIRHPHCAFPGCDHPASVCQVHHLRPRSRGGPATVGNLVNLCTFHHQTAIHRWGWVLRLHPDGTTTATSPTGDRTLHSHGPPPGRVA